MINLIKIDQKWINELKFYQTELEEEYEGPVYVRRTNDLKEWIIEDEKNYHSVIKQRYWIEV